MVLWLLDHDVQQELCGALHDGIVLLEEVRVARKGIVLPDVLAEPGAADGPHAELRPIDRRGSAPEVEIMVGHPAACSIVGLGRLGAGDRGVFEHVEQRLVAFGQIADLGRPIIHLRIDVDRVLASPRRRYVFIPDRLEIGRLAAGAAAGYQGVAAELEAEGFQVRIDRTQSRADGGAVPRTAARFLPAIAANGSKPGIGRLVVRSVVAQEKMHAVHQPGEVGHVPGAKRGVFLARDRVEDLLAPGCGIAADVAVIDEAGRRGDNKRDGVGPADLHAVLGGRRRAALWPRGERDLETQSVTADRRDPIARDRPVPVSVHDQLSRPGGHHARERAF